MLQIVNHTPFEALLGMFTDADGHDVASVVLVATLDLGGELQARRGELWTVVLEPDEQRVSMVWGARCRVGKQPSRLGYVVVSTEDA